jgi:heterodisulfide reductase subunit B
MLAVFKALEIPLEELSDWNCCGATSYVSIDETKAFVLAARNLALAELQSDNGTVDIVAPCSACFLVLTKTQHYLNNYPDINEKVESAMSKAGLHYHGKAKVRHPLDVLVNDYGLDKISKRVKNPLKGLKVASYYGCQVVRPFHTFDHSHYPESMDKLMGAIGAQPVDWPLKTRCCGGSLTGTIQEAGLRLNRLLLKEAHTRDADVRATCCPLCQHNLECYQGRINRIYHENIDMPVAYFTQLLGASLGLSERELGMHRLFNKIPLNHSAREKGAMANVW